MLGKERVKKQYVQIVKRSLSSSVGRVADSYIRSKYQLVAGSNPA